jgi:dGTPase
VQKSDRFHPFKSDFRNPFDRDRDRVIHSEWFRALEYKTQVFINSQGDYFRTRLTHSLEVSQIARTIAKNLELNESLAEVIAISHDLGHTPFGHVGGDALDEALKKAGSSNGFEHNFQSFRVLTKLEKRYPDFDGLNLTFATLEGVLKHSAPYKKPFLPPNIDDIFKLDYHPSFEAMVVDNSDTIAYTAADIDDALKYQLIGVDDILESPLVAQCAKTVVDDERIPMTHELFRYRLITKMLTVMIVDFINNSKETLQQRNNEMIKADEKIAVGFSDEMYQKIRELKRLLYKKVYRHELITKKMFFGKQCVLNIFQALSSEPTLLPKKYLNMTKENNTNRVVADFISSLSDRAAIELYRELY